MMLDLLAGRGSWVGWGLSWNDWTASVGKSAWPFTGAPDTLIVFGGLRKYSLKLLVKIYEKIQIGFRKEKKHD